MEMTKKEEKKSELGKELVYKPIYLPVRFFKKEAYIHIDDYIEAINKRENAVNGLEEENKNLKSDLEQFSEAYKRYRDFEKEELAESCYDLEKENKKLKEENEELKDAMKELNNYNEFLIQENERQKSKTITVPDEDNRIILEKGEDGRRHSYGGGNIVLC